MDIEHNYLNGKKQLYFFFLICIVMGIVSLETIRNYINFEKINQQNIQNIDEGNIIFLQEVDKTKINYCEKISLTIINEFRTEKQLALTNNLSDCINNSVLKFSQRLNEQVKQLKHNFILLNKSIPLDRQELYKYNKDIIKNINLEISRQKENIITNRIFAVLLNTHSVKILTFVVVVSLVIIYFCIVLKYFLII